MNDKQQQLLFDKGITNVPSDAICSDNALSECVGLTYENGEMKPIQKAAVFFSAALNLSSESMAIPTILYVHQFNNEERYIGYSKTSGEGGSTLYPIIWGIKNSSTFVQKGSIAHGTGVLYYQDGMQVTSIGKTLIFTDATGTHYHIWSKNGASDVYTELGDSFPSPNVEFKLGDRNSLRVYDSKTASGIYYQNSLYHIDSNKQGDWNNTVIGLYSELRKKMWQKKAFVGSFCVRAALELYDGTYYLIENPVFMLNHFSAYGVAYLESVSPISIKMEVFGQYLYYKFNQDYTKWSDIIKNVVLFVTREANLFDTASDAILKYGPGETYRTDKICYFMSNNGIYADAISVEGPNNRDGYPSMTGTSYIVMESIPDSDIESKIKDGVYYKLCEIGTIGDNQFHLASDNFDTHTIENITTQTQLGEDEYYSHCQMTAGTMYAYNSRLNLTSVSRSFFEGFNYFMPFETTLAGNTNTSSNYTFYVTIRTDGGDVIIEHIITTTHYQGIYFYYPDPRAIHVVIKKGDDYILNADLKEHPTLHGAYYFAGVSPSMEEPDPLTGDDIPTVAATDPVPLEVLPNYVIQSEVNNPFVFKAAGYFKVGTGKIIGMSSITQALSEGQFGQYPLLVFSDTGIWALSVASTGFYDSIHPISREVCTLASSITQTDGAVYFVSKKGLMVVVGSQVKCVSEQLNGKAFSASTTFSSALDGDFKGFLSNCMIAYDYRDSQLIIINPTKDFQWVYNMKSGAFSMVKMLATNIINVISNYPDNLIQTVVAYSQTENSYPLYSLLNKPEQNSDTNTYGGSFITRPMKLENAMVPKTIMDIRNIKTFTPYGTPTTTGAISLAVYGSNNLFNWIQLKSLRGLPWKYYRFKYTFTGLKAVDRFAGCVVRMQERRRLTK